MYKERVPQTTPRRRAPAGYVPMIEAQHITGLSRETLTKAAGRGEIPGAIQRKPKTPWYFTIEGLRRYLGIHPERWSA